MKWCHPNAKILIAKKCGNAPLEVLVMVRIQLDSELQVSRFASGYVLSPPLQDFSGSSALNSYPNLSC